MSLLDNHEIETFFVFSFIFAETKQKLDEGYYLEERLSDWSSTNAFCLVFFANGVRFLGRVWDLGCSARLNKPSLCILSMFSLILRFLSCSSSVRIFSCFFSIVALWPASHSLCCVCLWGSLDLKGHSVVHAEFENWRDFKRGRYVSRALLAWDWDKIKTNSSSSDY